ncbi:helix-turn-helix transcriptional regulator [Cochleicola gelatinilyticus]|uniref:HTH araC/xylS-type domain-containing protein n=1 Tax=Cochleicola gelatinilyticus TaxID=1763537 RepID=A0A167J8D3_9FLAO|nr:AraC family transcriptional regulator [Cochleicola gelatinilyticus]OAB80424.1 hypothetical protein ULVI_06725 [Cochleicola gelatinilyticus]
MKILTKGNYYGEKKTEITCNGVVLSEYSYHIPETDWHFHENPYFMYVLQGEVFDSNKKRTLACASGSLLLHNWDEQHSNKKHSDSARGFHIEFERSWFEEKKLSIDLATGSTHIEHPKMHHILAKLYFEFHCQDTFSEVSIDLLLLQLSEGIQVQETTLKTDEPNWVASLKSLLHEETEDLSLTSLSEKLNVHPMHLSRAVPKYLATTLGDYIRQQKIKKAFGYLLDPKLSLTEIAYRCGFSDQSHFTRTFKTYLGYTPSVFRNKITAC